MISIALISPDEYAGLVARLTLSEARITKLESQMATEVEAVANLTTQVTELTAAVAVTTTFITDLKAQVVALQEAVANAGDVSAEVTALAEIIDTAEKALLAAVTPAGGGSGPVIA